MLSNHAGGMLRPGLRTQLDPRKRSLLALWSLSLRQYRALPDYPGTGAYPPPPTVVEDLGTDLLALPMGFSTSAQTFLPRSRH